MATMTVARLHKMLCAMVEQGKGRRPVCVNKASFYHPLEDDGVTILDVTDAKEESITIADGDGWAETNANGSERTRNVLVLGGGYDEAE